MHTSESRDARSAASVRALPATYEGDPATAASGVAHERSSVRNAIFVLAALCVPLYFVATGSYDLDMKGEPREAITAWEVLHGPHWMLPLLNGERLPEKPIMFPWLVAVSMRVFGETSEWALRIPSAVMATGLVLVVFGIGRRLLGLRAGFFAALATASTFLVVSLARRARVDMTLSFFACFALLQFVAEFQRAEADPSSRPSRWRLAGLWLAMAFATLTKGPLGMILVVVPAGTFLLVRRRAAFARRLCPWWGVPTLVVVAGSWYAFGLEHRGGAFGFRAFLMENVLMFLGSEGGGGHRHGPFYFVPYYFACGLPWSLLFPAAVLLVVRRARGAWSREPALLPLLWFGTLFLFFSIASGKRSDYLLPLLPAAALVVAAAWDAAPRADDALARRALAGSAWALAALGVAGVVAVVVAARLPADALPAVLAELRARASVRALLDAATRSPGATVTVMAGIVVATVAPAASMVLRRPGRGLPVAAAAIAVAVAAGVATFEPPLAAADTLKQFTADAWRIAGPAATIHSYDSFEPQFIFHSNRRVPSIPENRKALLAFLDEPGEGFLLMTRDDFETLGLAAHPRVEIALESHRAARPREEQSLLLRRVAAR